MLELAHMTEKKVKCPFANLRLISKKHVMAIIYILRDNPLGFNDIHKKLSVNTATLTVRLRELRELDIIEMSVSCKDSRQHYYGLTRRGQQMSTLLDLFSKI